MGIIMQEIIGMGFWPVSCHKPGEPSPFDASFNWEDPHIGVMLKYTHGKGKSEIKMQYSYYKRNMKRLADIYERYINQKRLNLAFVVRGFDKPYSNFNKLMKCNWCVLGLEDVYCISKDLCLIVTDEAYAEIKAWVKEYRESSDIPF